MGLFFNFLVGIISKECRILESEVRSALACSAKEMEKVENVSVSQAIVNYKKAWNWRKKKEAIWQIYHNYSAKYGKL